MRDHWKTEAENSKKREERVKYKIAKKIKEIKKAKKLKKLTDKELAKTSEESQKIADGIIGLKLSLDGDGDDEGVREELNALEKELGKEGGGIKRKTRRRKRKKRRKSRKRRKTRRKKKRKRRRTRKK
jgi:hypothetical protein